MVPGGTDPTAGGGVGEPATAEPDAAGAAPSMSGVIHVTRPKRDALWKLPCPRMGENATPELLFMA